MFLSRCVDDAVNYARRNKQGRCNLSLPPLSPRPYKTRDTVLGVPFPILWNILHIRVIDDIIIQ